jgi:hypothetical protein
MGTITETVATVMIIAGILSGIAIGAFRRSLISLPIVGVILAIAAVVLAPSGFDWFHGPIAPAIVFTVSAVLALVITIILKAGNQSGSKK